MEHLGNQDGGRAVRCADDSDGGRVHKAEAKKGCEDDGQENTELRRRAEQQHFRVRKQGAEVDHRADADEQEKRHGFRRFNTDMEQPLQNAVCRNAAHRLVQHAGKRDIHENRAEAHGHEQGRFKILCEGEIDQQAADGEHHELLPVYREKAFH